MGWTPLEYAFGLEVATRGRGVQKPENRKQKTAAR